MAVTFDGPLKLMILSTGTTAVDVQEDLYEEWKDWVVSGVGAPYLPAFLSEGNVDVGGGLFTGKFFILINGWKIRPDEADHTLTITGNIYGDGGAAIIEPTLGIFQVLVTIERSLNAAGVSTSGGSLTAANVWDYVDSVTSKTMRALVRGDIDSYTFEQAIRVLLAVAAGKTDIVDLGGGSATVTFRDTADTLNRVTASLTGSERTSVTLVTS